MAKQICMIQRTPEGKAVRQYLIDLEKAWNTPEQVFSRALKLADKTIDSLKERCKFLGVQVVEQQRVIGELEPKASYYDTILQCKDLIPTTIIAKDYGRPEQYCARCVIWSKVLKIEQVQIENWFG